MVRCVNKKCDNYKQELDGDPSLCPACNTPTEKYVSTINTTFRMIAIFAAVLAFGIIWSGWGIWYLVGVAVSIAGIVLGFLSKSKLAIVISIISFISVGAITIIELMQGF